MFKMTVLNNVKLLNSQLSAITHSNRICILRETFVRGIASFKFSDLQIIKVKEKEKKPKPNHSSLAFGHQFSDHMFEVEWSESSGWGTPIICPLHDLCFHPAAKVFHYAQELFEGMKAFRSVSGEINLFRPDMNIKRLLSSAKRADLPAFDGEEFLKCLKRLVKLEEDWVPNYENCSLYVRPTFIGIEPSLGVASSNKALLYIITGPVGPYFRTGIKPVSLLADPQYVRAWPGGVGDRKLGSNYGPTIYVQKQAEAKGSQQVLWLFGNDHQLSEAGTMNMFVFLINSDGEKELVTPPLDGTILPGVVRQSLLDLARKWNEFKVSERPITMMEVKSALKNKRLLEMFGAGTACVVCPVSSINYLGEHLPIPTMDHSQPLNLRFLKALTDIQYGKIPHVWSVPVE